MREKRIMFINSFMQRGFKNQFCKLLPFMEPPILQKSPHKFYVKCILISNLTNICYIEGKLLNYYL